MYFWNIDALKRQLAHGGLSEKQTYGYMLAYLVCSVAAVEMMRYFPEREPNAWTYFGSMMNLLIPVVGTMMAFRANGGESGVQFLSRYMSISFVVTLRFLARIFIMAVPFTVLLVVAVFVITEFKKNLSSSPIEIVFTGIYALLFFYIVEHMGEVARRNQVELMKPGL